VKNVRDEREICDCHLVTDQPRLLGENTLEHTEDTQHLLLVALDCARDLLRMVSHEPRCLAIVRSARLCSVEIIRVLDGAFLPLSRRLEVEPLPLDKAVLTSGRDLMVLIVHLNEVFNDSIALPIDPYVNLTDSSFEDGAGTHHMTKSPFL
jgi:hypothetical protein